MTELTLLDIRFWLSTRQNAFTETTDYRNREQQLLFSKLPAEQEIKLHRSKYQKDKFTRKYILIVKIL